MPGFSSYDDMITEITTNGKVFSYQYLKAFVAAQAAGQWMTGWTAVGAPGAGAAPATTPGTAYGNTAGGITLADTTTDLKALLTFGACATQNSTVMLYDRLVGVSGISIASTGAKTISSTALTRYTGTASVGVQAWLEVTTATTTTAAVVNLNSYTNEGGTAARSGGSYTFPNAAMPAGFACQLPMQAGDMGLRSVEVGLNVGTATTAGVVNVVLIRPLTYLPLIANQWNERDLVLQLAAMPRVFDQATLGLMLLASNTTATTVWGSLNIAWG